MSEGIRRLSLLLGLLGAMCGLYGSWLASQEELNRLDGLAVWEEQKVWKTEASGHRFRFVAPKNAENLKNAVRGWWAWQERESTGDPLGLLAPGRFYVWDRDVDQWRETTFEGAASFWKAFLMPPEMKLERSVVLGRYSVIVALPFVGFVLPWGSLRIISWVSQGFIRDWDKRRERRKGDGAP